MPIIPALMYAIIHTGGKQYKISPEEIIKVERLAVEPGKTFSFKEVLLASDGKRTEIGAPYIKGAEVICEVLGEEQGKKVIAFFYRRRKKSRRTRGHRQITTELKVKEIKF